MKRMISADLDEWRHSDLRKPLILRGARQVGKTHCVRQLGEKYAHFVEINLERGPEAAAIFQADLDPKRILRELSLLLNEPIVPGKTLLFLDEIQGAPAAITALRYFYEEMPDLHVIAAGSLLDFAIESVGVPVGRVSFMYLYSLTFMEFLVAMGHTLLVKVILEDNLETISDVIHQRLLDLLGVYMAIGGMPEAVKQWRDTEDPLRIVEIHETLIQAYVQDFQKYAKQHQVKYVDTLFQKVPQLLGQRFKYSNVSTDYRKRELAPALALLEKARVIHSVTHSDGQGIPLGARVESEIFKCLFLDVGLAQSIMGLNSKDWFLSPNKTFVNKGALVEAFVGQELLAYGGSAVTPSLHYWHRMARGSSAEIDYLITHKNEVIPIEVKSGSGGQLKSLHLFLQSHPQTKQGVRFSPQPFSTHENIVSLPLYAVPRFLEKNITWF